MACRVAWSVWQTTQLASAAADGSVVVVVWTAVVVVVSGAVVSLEVVVSSAPLVQPAARRPTSITPNTDRVAFLISPPLEEEGRRNTDAPLSEGYPVTVG
jgi:hypothetical protein